MRKTLLRDISLLHVTRVGRGQFGELLFQIESGERLSVSWRNNPRLQRSKAAD